MQHRAEPASVDCWGIRRTAVSGSGRLSPPVAVGRGSDSRESKVGFEWEKQDRRTAKRERVACRREPRRLELPAAVGAPGSPEEAEDSCEAVGEPAD